MLSKLASKARRVLSVLDRDGNLGLAAGLFMASSQVCLLLEHQKLAVVLGTAGLAFAVRMGLLKRAAGKAKRGEGETGMAMALRNSVVACCIGAGIILVAAGYLNQPKFKRAPSEKIVELIEIAQVLPEAKQVLMDKFERKGSLDLSVADYEEVKTAVNRLNSKEDMKTYMTLLSLMSYGANAVDNWPRAAACSGLSQGYRDRGMAVPEPIADACDLSKIAMATPAQ